MWDGFNWNMSTEFKERMVMGEGIPLEGEPPEEMDLQQDIYADTRVAF
jgi:hypothetical protein